jgi:hypothetical protein
MEYAVRAETKGDDVVTLKRGFSSQADAEDYPIHMSLWWRVWVEPVKPSAPNAPRSAG